MKRLLLPSVVLLACAGAFALGWCVHRMSRIHRDIVGTWYYPTNDGGPLGYTSMLEVRPDGTFTKIQGYKAGGKTFAGTYAVEDDGRVKFRVTSKTHWPDHASFFGREPTPPQSIDAEYSLRCAVDPAGFLVIGDDWFRHILDDGVGVQWETCASETRSAIQGRGGDPAIAGVRQDKK